MNENMMQYEETIDLKDLCVYVLRKWRVLLIAVVVGALALGAYKAVAGPGTADNAAGQAAIEKLEETIETNEKELSNKEAELELHRASLGYLQSAIASCEQALIASQELLEAEMDPELQVILMSEITSMNVNILDNTNQILSIENQITVLEEEIEEIRVTIADTEGELAEKAASAQPGERTAKDIIKFVILGAVAGGFVVCGVVFVQYFLDKKLRRADELKERYGLRILGDFHVPVQKKSKIDQILDRMEGYRGSVDVDREAALAAAKVQVLSPAESECQRIFVTGTVDEAVIASICQGLQKHMPAAQYQICALANPVYDAEALLQIRQSIVVMVEVRGVSVKKEIASLVDILQAGKARVLGIVLQ